MGNRGRTSAAALSIMPPAKAADAADPRRPAAPAELTEDQAAEWRAIVARMPEGWFPRETHPLLAQYCRLILAVRFLSGVLAKIEAAEKFDLDGYERVAKMIGRDTALITSLARSMRISQHATYDKKKSKGPVAPRPWEE